MFVSFSQRGVESNMAVDDGTRRRNGTFAGLLFVLSALGLAAALARRPAGGADGPRLDPGSGVIESSHAALGRLAAGGTRRNLRLALTSDPKSVAPREPPPAAVRLYVSVSSLERVGDAARTWAAAASLPSGTHGVTFLLDGETVPADIGSLRRAYPHVEVLDARADVGQDAPVPGHRTARAMFALQRGRPEGFSCLLGDDLAVNIPILQRELQYKCQSDHCIMGEILGRDGERWTAGGWCMGRALVDSIGELLAATSDDGLPWPASRSADAHNDGFHDMLRRSRPDLSGRISYVPSELWYTESSIPLIGRNRKVSKRTRASYRNDVFDEMQASFLSKVSREFLSGVASVSAVYPAGWDGEAVMPPRRDGCPRPILDAIGIYSDVRDGDPANLDHRATTRMGLEDTILLVSSNLGHVDLLDNWRHYADRLGLKYGIVAMDNELYSLLGEGGAVLAGNHDMATGAHRFRSPQFNAISCNKLSIVLDIMVRIANSIFKEGADARPYVFL